MLFYFFNQLYLYLINIDLLNLMILFNKNNIYKCDNEFILNPVIAECIKSQVGFVEENRLLGKNFMIFVIYDGTNINHVINNLHTLILKSDVEWYWVFTHNKGQDMWYICNYVENAVVLINNKEVNIKLLLLTDEYQYWEYFEAWPLIDVLLDTDTYYLRFKPDSYMYGRGFISEKMLDFEDLLKIQNDYSSTIFQKFYILREDKDKGFFLVLKK